MHELLVVLLLKLIGFGHVQAPFFLIRSLTWKSSARRNKGGAGRNRIRVSSHGARRAPSELMHAGANTKGYVGRRTRCERMMSAAASEGFFAGSAGGAPACPSGAG